MSGGLHAVEGSYRQTVRDLGYEEGPVQSWVSAVMFRLQGEVKEQVKLKMLETSHAEAERTEPGSNNNVVDIRRDEEKQ